MKNIQLIQHTTMCHTSHNVSPIPQPLTQQQLKQHQRTKITKQSLLPPPNQLTTQGSQYQN